MRSEKALEFGDSHLIFVDKHILKGAWFDNSQHAPDYFCLRKALFDSLVDLFTNAVIIYLRTLVPNLPAMHFKFSALEIGEVL